MASGVSFILLPDEQIVNACVHNLNWSHFRAFLRVPDSKVFCASEQYCIDDT